MFRPGLPTRKGRRLYRGADMLDALIKAILEQSNRPLTASEIVDRSYDHGSPTTAAQVYRVLNRLLSRGVAQWIELLAAYLPVQDERKGFMVCRCCQSIESFPISVLVHTIDRMCQATSFSVAHALFEVSGVCTESTKSQTSK